MIELRPFQKEDLRKIYDFRGKVLLASEMGTGKTIEGLAWIHRTPSHRPVLIVCPSSVKYAWQAEAQLHFKMRARILSGQGPKRKLERLTDPVIVANYDILPYWLPVLLRSKIKTIIFDEAHYVANPRALRSRAVKKISKKCSTRIGMSGTPMTNEPIQLWSILNIIRPDLFPIYSEFGRKFCYRRWTPWGMKYSKAKNKKKLFKILKREVMIRRLKKDVAPELPDKIHQVIPYRMSSRASAEYFKASEKFIEWLREKSKSKARKAERNKALVKVGYLFRLVADLKIDWMIELIRDFADDNPGEKVVGLSMHTKVIDRLMEEFPESSVKIDGSVTGDKRQAAVRKFNSNKNTRFLWGNWKAAGAGLNLQVASTFFALDLPWTPGDLLQGIDRIHRIGQKKKCLIKYPILKGTVEEKWLGILREKTETLRAILDGKSESNEDSFGELLKAMTKK
jgi:SWI/SNF-related matrix-associated actin-dependent regulator 1 of chromatin subfamily A